MKKIITFLLALTMVFCFAACGSSDNGAEEPGNSAGLANPMTEVESLDALNEEFGCAMITPGVMGVSDEKFFSIAGDPAIAEYDFTVNGMESTLRFAVAGMDTDISGYYKQIDEGMTAFQGSETDQAYYECNEAKLARWFTIDGQYVLMIKDNSEMEYNTFDAIVEEFRSVKPVNWNSDGDFERLKALEGYYQDETSQRAIAEFIISGDHGKVSIMWGNSAVETYTWEMNVNFDENDNLAYEKETRLLYTADESGVSTSEELPEGGAGYIELKDGKLYFTGANDESLRECVFSPIGISDTPEAE